MKKATPVDWSHWKRLRSVAVWEASLLSLDINPIPMVQDETAGFSDPFWEAPWFSSDSFTSPDEKEEYEKRLRVIRDGLTQPGSFEVVSQPLPNQNMWKIHLAELARWLRQTGLSIPPELEDIAAAPRAVTPETPQSTRQTQRAVPGPSTEHWAIKARDIGLGVAQEKPRLSLDQIAKLVHGEMTKRHNAGEPGMTGRGDRLPTADSIRRHALIGIKR